MTATIRRQSYSKVSRLDGGRHATASMPLAAIIDDAAGLSRKPIPRERNGGPMRHVFTLFTAISWITFQADASETRSSVPTAGQPAVRACAMLTRDLVAPFT